MASASVPSGASAAVLLRSDPIPEGSVSVEGPNLDNDLTLQEFLQSYERIGFQATSFGRAVHIVDKMVRGYDLIKCTLEILYSFSAKMATRRRTFD